MGTGLAHLHVGCVEVPERGQRGRQPLRAVPDPQGLEMARGDPRLLTEALEGIGDKRPQRLLPRLQRWDPQGVGASGHAELWKERPDLRAFSPENQGAST